MSALALVLLPFATALALVLVLAIVLVVGALSAASLLPHGSPLAGRLRRFAGAVPRLGRRAVPFLDSLIFAGILALAVLVTVAYA